ncbi:MAG: hypothetical protein ABIK25_07275 [Pseudomonadota bacterium]
MQRKKLNPSCGQPKGAQARNLLLGVLLAIGAGQAAAFTLPWVNRPVVSEPVKGVMVITTKTIIIPAPWAELDAYSDNEQMRLDFIEAIQRNGRTINTTVANKIDVQKSFAGQVSEYPMGRSESSLTSAAKRFGDAVFEAAIKLSTGESLTSILAGEVLKQSSDSRSVQEALPADASARMVIGKLCYQDYSKCGEFAAVTTREDLSIDDLWKIATQYGATQSIKMDKKQ